MPTTIIKEPDSLGDLSPYMCRARAYKQGHSMLWVEVYTKPHPTHLVFDHVAFYSGLMVWSSSRLITRTDNVRELMIKAGYKPEHFETLADWLDFRLYVFEGTDPEVQILAREISVTTGGDDSVF